ncbi:F-box/LRR-repeat protein At5g02910-like [Lactuca sativa]|uniref:F-box/LRR-repeat protein At5g02910-like n=1 Tax=Lactuca sativa TaxID=4236 RepID=UPI000CD8685A|nr:F-box/LRR-repeat protein At5g02910-like [Lactuca sativa]
MTAEEDRLNSLPDEIIHKILSFISLREAVGASVLSSRWRRIWTSMPYLNFSIQDLFPQFVSKVLSRCNNQTQVDSVKLVVGVPFHDESFKKILHHAFSHSVQQLSITCSIGSRLSLYSPWSIEDLLLSTGALSASSLFMEKPIHDIPSLTTLHLDEITLSDKCTDLFSKFTNLNNLSLCTLTLEQTYWRLEAIKVVAPQLKNLSIKFCSGKSLMKISAPGLTSLVIKGGCRIHQLSTQGFPSLENADLCIFRPTKADAHKIVCLLQKLHNVKFLTLNLEILELLTSSVEPISHQHSPFGNLKILKFLTSYPTTVYMEVQPYENVTTSTEIKNTLQDSFPSAIFTTISCEEIRGMRNIVCAQQLIAELRMLLEKCKALGYTNKARMGHTNAAMESCKTQVNKQ